uniref:Uncharacterized protein n=1 Tax=Sipha flava TaxID=143950 RepID=A0A2S2QAG3_9HEMI
MIPNFFWKYIRTLKSNKSSIPSSVKWDDVVADNIENTSKLFANYFSSVYSCNNIPIMPQELPYTNYCQDHNLNSWVIFETEILDSFGSLNQASGAGPDSLPPIFLTSCLPVLIKSLHYLFNRSLSIGVFPHFWKKSYITPTFKSGDRSNVTNYRPISKLSIILKAFEAIITKKLSYLISKNISIHQHGFLSKHSIQTNLIFKNFLTKSVDKGYQVDTILRIFKKRLTKLIIHYCTIN